MGAAPPVAPPAAPPVAPPAAPPVAPPAAKFVAERIMSTRHVRKVYGGNELPPPDSDCDEEFGPVHTKSVSSFQGLEISSDAEIELEENDPQEDDTVDEAAAVPREDISKKKKKKKNKKKKYTQSQEQNANGNCTKKELSEMDEIDKCVYEINALLGTPEPREPPKEAKEIPLAVKILLVQEKHLDPENELRRKFGPAPEENRRRRHTPQQARLKRKAIIVSMDMPLNFPKLGVFMSLNRRDEGNTYFTFNHDSMYQEMHRVSLLTLQQRVQNIIITPEEAQIKLHIEGLIENADSLFRLEDFQIASSLIEQAIACYQYVWLPSFNLSNPKTRLEYKFLENRPFHIALLKYAYLLSNKACHRTALEVAKVLLNLDPSDPLAVIFVIDTFAIRAREYQWLVDATHLWSETRHANYMFNFKYSYALAHFHLAQKNKKDVSEADSLLREALIVFPTVFAKFIDCGASFSEDLKKHPLFNSIADGIATKEVKDLMLLYARLSWSWWREPDVFDWLNRVAKQLIADYDQDSELKTRVNTTGIERRALLRAIPEEVTRHLYVIKAMSNLIAEGAVPPLPHYQSPIDPVPPAVTIDRYKYNTPFPNRAGGGHTGNTFFGFFSSAMPDYNIPPEHPDAPPNLIDPDTIRNHPTLGSIELAVVHTMLRLLQDVCDNVEENIERERRTPEIAEEHQQDDSSQGNSQDGN